jgi:hypothetical protein
MSGYNPTAATGEPCANLAQGSTIVESAVASRRIRDRFMSLEQLRQLPATQSLVHGLLDVDSLVLAYGRRGGGKSFWATELTACVSLGERWHGRLVEHAPALYVVAESPAGVEQRYAAWQAHHAPLRQPPDVAHLAVLAEPVNLLNVAMVGEFADAAVEHGAKLIVLDTLARCMVGGDENSARDAGLAVEQLDVIRRRTGACVVVIHHSGKDPTAGGRGSSAFEAAADIVLEIGTVDEIMTIRCTKQKNHAEPNPIRLKLQPMLNSAVLVKTNGSDGMPPSTLETLAALSEVVVTGGVAASVWALSSGKPAPTFYRHRKDLVTLGLVSNIGTDKQPRYQVTEAGALTLSQDSHDHQ